MASSRHFACKTIPNSIAARPRAIREAPTKCLDICLPGRGRMLPVRSILARASAMIARWPLVNEYRLHKRATPHADRSFCVALRPQPIDALASQQSFIDISFALEALDVPKFGTGVVGLDLPVALSDAVEFENDLGDLLMAVVYHHSEGARKPDMRGTAWWSWQDANLQPSDYEPVL